MTNILYLSSIMVMVFCVMGLIASIMLTRTSRAVTDRMMQVTRFAAVHAQAGPGTFEQLQKQLLESVRLLRSRLGMSEDEKLLKRFASAGFNSSGARDTYFATRMLLPAVAIAIAFLLPSNRFFWIMSLGGVAYLLPDMVLSRLVKRRREKIRRSVPDAVDLLVICVDAGLGLDQAMLRVGQELSNSHPEIHEEFMQINREQRAGKLRLEAWQSMAERSGVPEIDGFVNMLMQTERFGTPIARALSNFGDGIRQKRRQHAEELAAKTTVKIIFPLVLFIFPSMFIVLLGPAAINIARGLSGATH